MRITVQQSDFQTALGYATRAIATRNVLPVLAGVLLDAKENRLRVTGTDLEIAISVTIPAHVEAEGSFVLPGRALAELVRNFSGGDVRLEVEGERRARIRWERSLFNIQGIPANQFPQIPVPSENAVAVSVSPDFLRNVIRRTVFAVSTDETRPILTGVFMKIQNGQFLAVATDGFRIASNQVTTDGVEGIDMVVPGRSLAELVRLLPASSDENSVVTIQRDGAYVFFDSHNIRLISRLIEGNYPDVKSLVPTEYTTQIVVNKQNLLDAVERAALVAGRQNGNLHLVKLDVRDGQVVVMASNADLGDAREEIPAMVRGESLLIGYNARYLIEGLKVMDSEDVEIGLIDPLKAGRIRASGESSFEYIVLPVKI